MVFETRYVVYPKGGMFEAAKTNSKLERLPLCSGRLIDEFDNGITCKMEFERLKEIKMAPKVVLIKEKYVLTSDGTLFPFASLTINLLLLFITGIRIQLVSGWAREL